MLVALTWVGGACCQAAPLTRNPISRALLAPTSAVFVPGSAQAQPLLFSRPLAVEPQSAHLLNPRHPGEKLTVEQIASRISYVGVVLLTADRIARSMDSVLETMQIRCPDGTCLQLDTSPGRRGLGMGVLLSRPLNF